MCIAQLTRCFSAVAELLVISLDSVNSVALERVEKCTLKDRMVVYREQIDSVRRYLSLNTYKPGILVSDVDKRTIQNQAKTHELNGR